MHARILALASLTLLLAVSWQAAGQTGDEKKKDAAPKREPDRLTAETEVNGKNLDQWIKLIPSKDRSLTKMAIEAVIVYGMSDPELAKRAVPAMIDELKKHNPPTHRLDLSVRTTIPQPLASILSSLKEPDPRHVKEAVGLLKRMIKNDDQLIVRFRATQAVAQMGPLAKDTIPELAHLVREALSETWELREAAVVALGTVAFDDKAPPQTAAVEALYFALKDPAVKVRRAAIQSLNMLRVAQDSGLKVKLKSEMIKVITNDADPFCKLRAQLTIYTCLDKTPEGEKEKKLRRATISKFLENPDYQIRLETIQALGLMGEEAQDQVSHLIGMLSDKDAGLVGLSIVALAHIKEQKTTVPALQLVVESPNMPELIRNTAKDAIDIINGKAKKEEPKKGDKKL